MHPAPVTSLTAASGRFETLDLSLASKSRMSAIKKLKKMAIWKEIRQTQLFAGSPSGRRFTQQKIV